MHEGVDAGVIGLVGARPVHEPTRHVGGAAALVLGEKRALDQRADEPRLVHQILGRKFVPRGKNPLCHAILTPQCRDHAMTR